MPPGLEAAFERIGSFLEHRLPLMHAPGAALAVTDREDTLGVVVRGFADAASGTPVRAETRFQIGSISKSFAAIVAVQEAEADRLDLHVPVTDLVPWVKLQQPFGPITMHHLLSHTSGLPIGNEDVPSALGAVWNLRDRAPGFAPGERFWYSNDGYKLVGVVLEHVTGRPIHELLRERLLEPLGMKHTTAAITDEVRADEATGYRTMYDDRPPRRDHPLVEAPWIVCNTADGSIVSDVIDMSAYMRFLLNRCEGVLSEDGFQMLTEGIIGGGYEGFLYAYGLNVSAGRARLRHSGGMPGFTAMMMVDMESGLGCISLVNGSAEHEPVVRYALDAVKAALDGAELPPVVPPPDPTETPDAIGLAGAYEGNGRRVELVADGDRLRMVEGEWSAILEPYEEGGFLVADRTHDTFLVTFARDGDGRPIELRQGADLLFRTGTDRPATEAPPEEWVGYTGHYRGPGLWEASFRVVLRGGRLWKISPNAETDEYDLPLVPLGDGSFRIGDEEWRPDFIRFEWIVDGTAIRAVLNGTAWHRWFTD